MQALFDTPLNTWSAATLQRWCAKHAELNSEHVEAAARLRGVTGAQLALFSDAELEDHGLPPRMRTFLAENLLLKERSSCAEAVEEKEDAPLLTPEGGECGEEGRAVVLVAGIASAAEAATEFLRGEREKRERGEGTDLSAIQQDGAAPALPYTWATTAAGFGLEAVRKMLSIGENVPLVGICFTLCMVVAMSAEQAMSNKSACAELALCT